MFILNQEPCQDGSPVLCGESNTSKRAARPTNHKIASKNKMHFALMHGVPYNVITFFHFYRSGTVFDLLTNSGHVVLVTCTLPIKKIQIKTMVFYFSILLSKLNVLNFH